MRAFEPLHSMLRAFVVLRVIIVSTLLLSAFLIQITFSTALPLNSIYYLAAFAYRFTRRFDLRDLVVRLIVDVARTGPIKEKGIRTHAEARF